MDVKTQTAESLSKFTEVIENYPDRRWYRGMGNSSYTLLPSLYRHPTIADAADLLKSEYEILSRFRQRSLPFINAVVNSRPRLNDDWEQLFIMQHFGVPTRLLDWSESPYIALFFALTSARYEIVDGEKVYSSDASVWVLQPEAWNAKSLSYIDPTPGILVPEVDDHLNGFEPTNEYNPKRHVAPVAIYGTHNSMRIVNQRGVFVLFGKGLLPMEQIWEANEYPSDCLMNIVIPASKIEMLLSKLITMGITDSVIYPDVSGLAIELKRLFKFNV